MSTDYGSSKGYTIQDRVSIGKNFFSLGHNPNAVQPYVVWQSNNETPHDFYWGHYFNTKQGALRDLHSRISGEVEFLLERIDKMATRAEKPVMQRSDMERGDER